MSLSPESPTILPATRSIRDMLMTYGCNGGKRLTDDELSTLLVTEITGLTPIEQQVLKHESQTSGSIRDMLVATGYNGGKRISDDDFAKLLLQEILILPDDQQDAIMAGMIGTDMPDLGDIRSSSPVA